MLTVVMPFLNEGDEPRKTIESIYDTTPPELVRVLAIDDASPDPSETFSDFEDVQYHRMETRMGSAGCKHFGAMNADTPYVFIIDAHMRFKKDDWALKLIEALKEEPRTAYCTVCLGLSEGRMNVHFPNGRYYGADLVLIDDQVILERPAREILEPKWASPPKEKGAGAYEIPCILGANYGFSTEWFRTIRGLDGLRMWGSEEPFMSLKTWLAGGKCRILTDVEIGHKFRDHAPYSTETHYLIYNKILLCRTILPDELGEKLIGQLPNDATFQRAMHLIEQERQFVADARAYYQELFRYSIYDYCERFGIPLPP